MMKSGALVEVLAARIPGEIGARVSRVLHKHETPSDFLRAAVLRELELREVELERLERERKMFDVHALIG